MTDINKNFFQVKLQHTQQIPKLQVSVKEEVVDCKMKKEKPKKKKIEDQEYEIRTKGPTRLARWSSDEDQIYARFLLMNRRYFQCENLRRTGKVFLHLSRIMNGVRTANQCKSHHQKMQKASKTGEVNQIIEYIEKKHLLTRLRDEYTAIDAMIPSNGRKQGDYWIQHITNMNGLEIILHLDPQNLQEW